MARPPLRHKDFDDQLLRSRDERDERERKRKARQQRAERAERDAQREKDLVLRKAALKRKMANLEYELALINAGRRRN